MKLGEILEDCDFIDHMKLDRIEVKNSDSSSRWLACRDSDHKSAADSLADLDISGVAYDSRKVKEGYLFVAIAGEKYDGHDFIGDVIKKGAVAVVGEKELGETESRYIGVKNSRKALACIANNFYEKPSESLTLIGVTGTNGKTTTTYILKSILEAWGKRVGLIGTIQYMINDRTYPALHTTPESLEFQGLLKDMLLSGCTHVISEVSSHALAQFRADRAEFNVSLFTNFTRDHLDFHKTMEDYYRAKERLFMELLDNYGTAVINLDDPYGKRLISSLTSHKPSQAILTYGIETAADIVAGDIDNSFQGLRFKISFRGRSYRISSYLIGLPNVYNIMSAVGASIAIGVPWQTVLDGVAETGNIKGRFEIVDLGQSFICMVDYAHTEDALEKLICTARELVTRNSAYRNQHNSPRVITVFGCGGDRDHSKRPGMGAVATRLSDFVFITSDNPRSEEPLNIIKDIEAGAVNKKYLTEPDRKEAIRKAVNMADYGDMVLVAGKGHEDYQEIRGIRYGFNDRDVLEEIIKDKLKIKNVK